MGEKESDESFVFEDWTISVNYNYSFIFDSNVYQIFAEKCRKIELVLCIILVKNNSDTGIPKGDKEDKWSALFGIFPFLFPILEIKRADIQSVL